MNSDLSFREYERFSAYLDGQLSPQEVSRLEEDLRRNPQWQLALDELRETRALLRRAPRYRAPRNFTLTPEMVGKTARPGLFSFLSARFAASMAGLALMSALILQFLPALRFAAPMAAAPAPQAQQAPAMEFAPQATQAAPENQLRAAMEPTAIVPIILWHAPGGMGGGGGAPEGQGGEAMKAAGAPSGEGIVTYNQDTTAKGMGGGAGDGTEGYVPPGEGIVQYGGQPAPGTIPPVVPTEESVRALQSEATPAPAQPLEGSGPILGVPAPEEAGQVIALVPAPQESAREFAAPVQAVPSFWTSQRIAQVILLALAVLFGGLALRLRRKG
ncbi:anti-sigma factor family protein [Anaerolinea thermophila]|uniref:Zinc-finger domain-containing protein n=1 Tax=Anaerolinea thermophila (strain DSM 14523 / JCM 11388 / NBRC 100420 / UNI-1) TaxID=926569 RepID=E8N228_ANATU|nr:hypothetical protein [Anaerolinea thermophila]BAJ64975.1 hypothetical protein ANT_29490 [Anaerolinea thermophila UNI-1]